MIKCLQKTIFVAFLHKWKPVKYGCHNARFSHVCETRSWQLEESHQVGTAAIEWSMRVLMSGQMGCLMVCVFNKVISRFFRAHFKPSWSGISPQSLPVFQSHPKSTARNTAVFWMWFVFLICFEIFQIRGCIYGVFFISFCFKICSVLHVSLVKEICGSIQQVNVTSHPLF